MFKKMNFFPISFFFRIFANRIKSIAMLRKTICLSILLLANVILLVHAAVPHHHHHYDYHYTREHEGQPAVDEHCAIDDVYTLAKKNLKIACCVHTECDCCNVFLTQFSDTFDLTNFVDETLIFFRQKHCFVAYHTDYISRSIGLRAPPVG
jgi:hypothetical protein